MVNVSMEGAEHQEPQIPVTVPLFLKKLWKMVNDKDAEHIIGWNSTGDGFVIYDQLQFIMKLLPQYFKHNNMASFIRQLNFYDFHKVASIDKDEIQFTHNYFLKDLPETLFFVRRKCASVKSKSANNVNEEELADLLNGVKEIKSKHSRVDTELKLLKQENAALWSEINNLRVKHSKQTKIINKIIHFLISYMHSHQPRGASVNRKNNQKNIKTGPTILELDYHNNSADQPKQAKQNAYTVTEPNQSEAITYDIEPQNMSIVQPSMEISLDDILNTVPLNLQETPQNSASGTSLEKLNPFSTATSSKVLENAKANTILETKSSEGVPILNVSDSSKENLAVNSKTDMLENLIFNTLANSKDDITQTTLENQNAGMLENSTLSTWNDPKKSLGLCTSNTQKMPVPFKNTLNYNILENPKENLGSYLDNTHTELLNLQDMLNNISSADLSSLFYPVESAESNIPKESSVGSDLSNLCYVIQDENVNTLGDTSNDNTKQTVPYAAVPMGYTTQNEATDHNSSESYFAQENTVPPEIQVDEYFNADFQI